MGGPTRAPSRLHPIDRIPIRVIEALKVLLAGRVVGRAAYMSSPPLTPHTWPVI